jgi:hypothetical protein
MEQGGITMKKFGILSRSLLAILLISAFTFGSAAPTMAQTDTETYDFVTCSNNNATNVDIGEEQLSVIVSILPNGNIQFRFENAFEDTDPLPSASSIARIFFHDPSNNLLSFVALRDSGVGVAFSASASPGTLPSANTCPSLQNAIGFEATESAGANPPPVHNGINPGEWLEIEMSLRSGVGFADIVSGLSTGLLRVGTHVIGFANGGSESFVNEPDPTYIQLDSFDVTPSDAGVLVEWATATEIDNAGFNLYRADSLAGPYVKINSLLIAAVGAAASYEFADNDGDAGDFYRLEDIDTNGVATLHVPIKAKAAQFNSFVFIPMVQGN